MTVVSRLPNPEIGAQSGDERVQVLRNKAFFPLGRAEQSMKFIIGVFAVAWFMSGCTSLSTVPDDDSVTGANLDMRTGLCTDATPPPCNRLSD